MALTIVIATHQITRNSTKHTSLAFQKTENQKSPSQDLESATLQKLIVSLWPKRTHQYALHTGLVLTSNIFLPNSDYTPGKKRLNLRNHSTRTPIRSLSQSNSSSSPI